MLFSFTIDFNTNVRLNTFILREECIYIYSRYYFQAYVLHKAYNLLTQARHLSSNDGDNCLRNSRQTSSLLAIDTLTDRLFIHETIFHTFFIKRIMIDLIYPPSIVLFVLHL